MKAKFSPLELLKFELLQSQLKFIVPEIDEIDVHELFKSYAVNIDFNHNYLEDEKIQVFVSVKVNNSRKPKHGYSMLAEGMGIFKVSDQENLNEKLLGNLKYYSTLNMMINNLRNIMYQTSNLGPMGGYLLPPIDILDLFKKKEKQKANSES
jgi:preprotein translocase subunit SecB